jgi:hypothetical protein
LEKLTEKYGKTAIFYDVDGLTNRFFLLFKHRHMSENDQMILDFISGKKSNYLYIIDYISSYIECIDFVFWPAEIALHTIYKILCERIIGDETLNSDTEEYKKLRDLAKKISLYRYNWALKMENK